MTGLQVLANKIDELGSRVDFARQLDISEPHLSMILSGRRGFSVKVGLKICNLTGLSLEQIAASVAGANNRSAKASGRRAAKGGARR